SAVRTISHLVGRPCVSIFTVAASALAQRGTITQIFVEGPLVDDEMSTFSPEDALERTTRRIKHGKAHIVRPGEVRPCLAAVPPEVPIGALLGHERNQDAVEQVGEERRYGPDAQGRAVHRAERRQLGLVAHRQRSERDAFLCYTRANEAVVLFDCRSEA